MLRNHNQHLLRLKRQKPAPIQPLPMQGLQRWMPVQQHPVRRQAKTHQLHQQHQASHLRLPMLRPRHNGTSKLLAVMIH